MNLQLSYICDLSRDVCISLKMSHSSLIFTQYLIHRYYYNIENENESCLIYICGSCILISGKLYDINQSKSIHNISNTIYHHLYKRENILMYKNKKLDFYGAEGYEWKRNIINTEKEILIKLGFKVFVLNDLKLHNYILIFINALMEHSSARDIFMKYNILQLSWNFANDCMLSNVCVVEKCEVLACACIHMAIYKIDHLKLPQGWQIVFGTSKEECIRVVKEVMKIYDFLSHHNNALYGKFVDYSHTEGFEMFHPNFKFKQKHNRDLTETEKDEDENSKKRIRFSDSPCV